MLPKVSVHLPSYRQRDYLRAAIESVLAQNYSHLEIVVGDDGSTDGTHELLRDYDSSFPGLFKLALSEVNRGTTANWNQIIPLCTGKYIAWLDGDDLWLPGKIEKQVQWMEAHPEAALCYTNTAIFDSATNRTLRLQHEARRNAFRSGGAEQLMLSGVFFATSTVMARHSALPAHGADPRLPQISDWLFWVDVAQHGTIGFVPEVLAKYRLHPNNITKRGDAILADQLLSMEIAASRYPQYRPQMASIRSETLWFHGLRYLAERKLDRAKVVLEESFRLRFRTPAVPLRWRMALWFLLRVDCLRLAVPMYRGLAELTSLKTRLYRLVTKRV